MMMITIRVTSWCIQSVTIKSLAGQDDDFIEDNVLSEDEKGFNQTVLYGRDVSVEDVVSTAKRYPMMAERQVVIVKEAQELSRTIDKFESYANNPMLTTVLVLCYKYKTLDKRKKVTKVLKNYVQCFCSIILRGFYDTMQHL